MVELCAPGSGEVTRIISFLAPDAPSHQTEVMNFDIASLYIINTIHETGRFTHGLLTLHNSENIMKASPMANISVPWIVRVKPAGLNE